MRGTLLLLLCTLLLPAGCSDEGGRGGLLDIGGELSADVPAHDIGSYEERPEEYCKGQIRREQFADYDWQCEAVLGMGKCVVITENPDPEDSTFFCTLCGLKGDRMVCYLIQQD